MTEAELELGRQLVSALMPHATAKRAAMIERSGRFVHYTSAESGLRIINSKRMWMRNTTCMADFSEVQHGFRTLNAFFRAQAKKDAFFAAAEAISPGLGPETVTLFNGWWDDIQSNIYVASLSEHDDKEDGHGRLSMWRAFGRNTASVAIVLRVPLDSTAGLSLNVTFVPVAYFTEQEMEGELNAIIQSLKTNRDFLRGVDKQNVLGALFAMLVWSVVALKHNGFMEEREWRAIYSPKRDPSPLMLDDTVVVNGVPQRVYKIPLEGGIGDMEKISIAHMLDRVIIGPTQFGWAMYDAFVNALIGAGVADAASRVFVSGIPLRS